MIMQDELVLFYRVKDLQSFDFKTTTTAAEKAENKEEIGTTTGSNKADLIEKVVSDEPSTSVSSNVVVGKLLV